MSKAEILFKFPKIVLNGDTSLSGKYILLNRSLQKLIQTFVNSTKLTRKFDDVPSNKTIRNATHITQTFIKTAYEKIA